MNQPNAKARWTKAKALVIDEVSMLDPDMFDKMDIVARRVKGEIKGDLANRVFGGMQVILCGDFFQLPPVPPKGKPVKFLFESNCWRWLIGSESYELETIFRQAGDGKFIHVLNEIRHGSPTPEVRSQPSQTHFF